MAIAKIYSVHDDTMELSDNSTSTLIAREKVNIRNVIIVQEE